MPLKVFISYAHKDERFKLELDEHLSPLRHSGLIEAWSDGEIYAGTDWNQAIATHLSAADVILLLISPAFLSSTYIYRIELEKAMERHNSGGAMVIPILVEDCYWQVAAFSKIQSLPSGMKSIASYTTKQKRGAVWAALVQSIHRSCENWRTNVEGNAWINHNQKLDDNTISLKSISIIDENEIENLLRVHGFNWPTVQIKWPQSSDSVLKIIIDTIANVEESKFAEAEGYDYFVKEAQKALSAASNYRQIMPISLPGVVKRLNRFEERNVVAAIRNFLLLANVRIYSQLVYLSTWQRLKLNGFETPTVWRPYRFPAENVEEAIYGGLLGNDADPDQVHHGRLDLIDSKVVIRSDGYFYVYGPKFYLQKYMSSVKDKSIICKWFIPQVEWDAISYPKEDGDKLINYTYNSEWVFSVIYDMYGKEIKSNLSY